MPQINPTIPDDGDDVTGPSVSVPFADIIALLNGLLDADNLANNAVTTAKIIDAAVTFAKMATLDKVRVTNSANQSTTTGVSFTTLFDTETFDTNSLHSTSANTGRLTAATTGYYLITGTVNWAANATGVRLSGIVLNGATQIAQSAIMNAGAGNDVACPVTTMYRLTAGDYVTLIGQQNSGGALNILSSYTQFSMTLIP